MISRPATTADFDAICHVLADTNLQTSDVSPQIGVFVVAEINGEIVGTAGVEQYGAIALLRSVATSSQIRGQGVALRLCAESIHTAREHGVRELYLLTTTAPKFFEKLGFGRLARGAAPDAIRQTCEFRELCPESAVLMRKELDADAARAAVVCVRDAYAAFLRGHVAPLVHLLAPNAVYHLPGGHMGGGRLQAVKRSSAAPLRLYAHAMRRQPCARSAGAATRRWY
jgi:amino-acid N-acetyltransferase